jgi:hypothetical protein
MTIIINGNGTITGTDLFTGDSADERYQDLVTEDSANSIVNTRMLGDGSNLTNVAAATFYVNESTDDDVAYELLFANVSTGGDVQMQAVVDDNGITFNPGENLLEVDNALFEDQMSVGDASPIAYPMTLINETGTANLTFNIRTGDTGRPRIAFGDQSDADIGSIVYHNDSDRLAFTANTIEAMNVASNGYIGLGTSAPLANLSISDSDNTAYDSAASDAQLSSGTTTFLQQTSQSSTAFSQVVFEAAEGYYNRIVSSGGTTPHLTFCTGNVENMTLSNSGDLTTQGALFPKTYNESVVALTGTSPTIDVEQASLFTITTSGATSFSFTNAPLAGKAVGFGLQVTAGGSYALTWPAEVLWEGGAVPSSPDSAQTNVYGFYTSDAGTSWFGFLSASDMS